ncbi:MAG TPA: Mut7-C RNAse domain-containing protein [bacterium]|nr:Mut7-C RNAse domain-containing protein [bacterium]
MAMAEEGVKFFCDDQLGKLCRWLRIIGQDAVYEREIADEELIARARSEGRTILTRDTRLAAKAPGAEVVLLDENYPAHQLREVVLRFGDRIEIRVFSRCVACNGEIEATAKEEVREKVPPFVFSTQEKFTRCKSCGKIYWQATHRERVDRALRDVLGELWKEA